MEVIIEKQLDYLNKTMKEKSEAAKSFLLKYHFGGLIAVLALLNVDLVMLDTVNLSSLFSYGLFFLGIVLVVILSRYYFLYVLEHYKLFLESHRKLKYKYELTLHFSLCKGKYNDYQYYLEKSISEDPVCKDYSIKKPEKDMYDFRYFADYLLNHHRVRFKKIGEEDGSYLKMAMTVIALTLLIKTVFIIIKNLPVPI